MFQHLIGKIKAKQNYSEIGQNIVEFYVYLFFSHLEWIFSQNCLKNRNSKLRLDDGKIKVSSRASYNQKSANWDNNFKS